MKLLEVDTATAGMYCNVPDYDEDGRKRLETVVMPAAKARLESYTGMKLAELNEHEEVTVAYLALCSFLYDNRSMVVENDRENEVLDSFLAAYRVNLLPSVEDDADGSR